MRTPAHLNMTLRSTTATEERVRRTTCYPGTYGVIPVSLLELFNAWTFSSTAISCSVFGVTAFRYNERVRYS